MRANGRGQIRQDVELLKLTGPGDRQEAGDGAFAVLAPVARDRTAARERIPSVTIPESEEPPRPRERLATDALRRGRLRQVLRAEEVAPEVGPATRPASLVILRIGRQPVGAQHASTRGPQQSRQHDGGTARGGDGREDTRRRHPRPEPAFLGGGAMSRFVAVEHGRPNACSSASPGAATAARASSHAFCVLPRLIGMCRTPASHRCPTRRGTRQTTVREALNAVSGGPHGLASASGNGANVVVPQAGHGRR